MRQAKKRGISKIDKKTLKNKVNAFILLFFVLMDGKNDKRRIR